MDRRDEIEEPRYKEISVEKACKLAGFKSVYEVQKKRLFGRINQVPVAGNCGCYTDPDGTCHHGFESVLRKEGLI